MKWYTVWSGNRIDEVFETKVAAQKHAAWLDFIYGYSSWHYKRISITDADGESISFEDYEFRNGDSRKIK